MSGNENIVGAAEYQRLQSSFGGNWVPYGTVYLLAPRRPSETDEEWGSRCGVIYNVGLPPMIEKEGAD